MDIWLLVSAEKSKSTRSVRIVIQPFWIYRTSCANFWCNWASNYRGSLLRMHECISIQIIILQWEIKEWSMSVAFTATKRVDLSRAVQFSFTLQHNAPPQVYQIHHTVQIWFLKSSVFSLNSNSCWCAMDEIKEHSLKQLLVFTNKDFIYCFEKWKEL